VDSYWTLVRQTLRNISGSMVRLRTHAIAQVTCIPTLSDVFSLEAFEVRSIDG